MKVTQLEYDAMKAMLNWYENVDHSGIQILLDKDEQLQEYYDWYGCIFCALFPGGCDECLWMRFENKTCLDWNRDLTLVQENPERERYIDLKLERIEMLKRWLSESEVE